LEHKTINLQEGQKIYFISDFHLGVPDYETSKKRELEICDFLERVQDSCAALFLLGDTFDFWFEYKHAIPKGYLHLFSTLIQYTKRNIPVSIFKGNHDLWLKDYLPKEIGLSLIKDDLELTVGLTKIYIHHGDGLGPGDQGYKFIKKIFTNPFFKWLFKWIHPDIGIGLANYFSGLSGGKTREKDYTFKGLENEWLIQHCENLINDGKSYDFLLFGHRHLPINHTLSNGSKYINTGDWLKHKTYACYDGKEILLKSISGESF